MKSAAIFTMAMSLGLSTWAVAAQDPGRPERGGDLPTTPQGGSRSPWGGPDQGERPMMPPLLAALDANGDGVIDAEEIANAPESLKKLDKNNDGRITMDEAMAPRAGGMRGPGGLGGAGGQGFGAGGESGQRAYGGRGGFDDRSAPLGPGRPPDGAPQLDSRARTAAELLNQQWSRGQAEGRGPVKLATFPLRVGDISHINPMGMMASGHTTPTDHLYLVAKESQAKGKLYDVLAVADGHVVVIQWRPNPPGGQPDPTVFDRAVDLKVVLEHSSNVWSYVDHLVEIEEFIRHQAGERLQPGQPVQVRIPVKAGQVIGKVAGGFTFDFALIDTTVTLKGFVVPEQFLQRDTWKLHTVDPFDYVNEPLRSQLLAFNPRKVPPVGGKIDYDLDGRLVGNWYREGTGGYAGLNRRWDYWVGHLAFAYHHVNPSIIIISVGEWDGRAQQFAVRGNSPDPAKVSQADGMVKYSLIAPQINNRTGQPFAESPERYYGTMLVQLLEDRKLRLEIFPGKAGDEVTGFSNAARLYER